MSEHKKFAYNSADELLADAKALGAVLPFSNDFGVLSAPLKANLGKTIPNRLAIHPMEGCDGTADGKPGELTLRRYDRFAAGGAGLVWVEATAVTHEGRANPRQLHLCPENADSFKRMFERMLGNVKGPRPYTVLQLTHSGRYSKPDGRPAPVIAARNPYLDINLPEDYPLVTDSEIEAIEEKFAVAAGLARQVGFDAVDVKSCHRYLNNELLSAFMRKGIYGGSFENRTRFLLNIVDRIKSEQGSALDVTLRLNVFDAIPWPYGWGVDCSDGRVPDLTEPLRLIGLLAARGIKLLNVTFGNPYYNPHVGRPFDNGPYLPFQHPLEGTAKMLGLAKKVHNAYPDLLLMATGFSWLREYAANVAAGGVSDGWFSIAGFGRQAFAYPDFARDILENGAMRRPKCCITCGKCSVIMRGGGMTGCVIKDSDVYGPIFRECRAADPATAKLRLAEHV